MYQMKICHYYIMWLPTYLAGDSSVGVRVADQVGHSGAGDGGGAGEHLDSAEK